MPGIVRVPEKRKYKIPWIALAVVISLASLAGLVLHLAGVVTFDTPALILCLMALVPWLSLFLENATLPGGWRLEFRRLQAEQKDQESRIGEQRAELDTLKFLLESVLTRWERTHLVRLAGDGAFSYKWQGNFETELIRLLALDFIERQPGKGIRSAQADRRPDNELRAHFRITERGNVYLARLAERAAADESELAQQR